MSKATVIAGWDDAPHLDAAAKRELSTSYLPHELDARTKGTPSLGAGAIYPVPESDVLCDPIQFPAWYRHLYALDVGWNRTAALWGALDPETDVLYLYSEHYRGQAEPAIHAAAIRARGEWIPGVIDPASRGRQQNDGEQLLVSYQALGLTLSCANNAVEAGIYEVWQRISTGRLKIFRTLQNARIEYRTYRRDEKGRIVKENDHLMDCMRYLVMGILLAAQRPATQWAQRLGAIAEPQIGYQSEYSPMAAMAGDGGSPSARQKRESWMPFQEGRR